MNIDQVFDTLKIIENKTKIGYIQYNKIPLWPFIRQELVSNATDYFGNTKYKLSEVIHLGLINLYSIIKYILYSSLKKNKTLKNKVIFLSGFNSKRYKKNDLLYDIYCDPIVDYLSVLGLQSIIFETSKEFKYSKRNYTETYPLQHKILQYQIKSIINSYFNENIIDNIFDELKIILYNTNLYPYLPSKRLIVSKVLFITYLKKYFFQILFDKNVKAIFANNFYGYIGISLMLVCNELKIKSFDIQHGVITKYHYAYGGWGIDIKFIRNAFPNVYLVWSSKEKEIINEWNREAKIYVTGNLFLENYKSNVKKNIYDKKYSKIILYTFQSYKIDINIFKLINKRKEYLWLLKFHPDNKRIQKKKILKYIKAYKLDNIDYYYVNLLPLYDTLNIIDVHITMSSSVILEAKFFGVKSIITHEIGYQYYKELVDSEYLIYEKNYDNILNIIESIKKNNIKKNNNSSIEFIKNILNLDDINNRL